MVMHSVGNDLKSFDLKSWFQITMVIFWFWFQITFWLILIWCFFLQKITFRYILLVHCEWMEQSIYVNFLGRWGLWIWCSTWAADCPGTLVGESLLHVRANRARVEALNYLDDREKELQILSGYPNVCATFLKYNTSLPSSAPVERLFSTGAPCRNKLSHAVFQQLLMLKTNADIWSETLMNIMYEIFQDLNSWRISILFITPETL